MVESSTPSDDSVEAGGVVAAKQPVTRRFWTYLQGEVDPKAVNPVSIYSAFLTGFTSAPTFSACYVWCGFQTGNVAQLGLALARTFNMEPYRTGGFQKPDQQALCSLLSFLIGATLGRIGDRMGAKRRTWLVTATFLQALMAMAAAIAAHFDDEVGISVERDKPSWQHAKGFVALAFLSASLGLQGIIGKRIGSPLNTTIVLTTTWVEIFNDPLLLNFHPTASRDVRLAGVFCVFLGAFCARAILGSRCGMAGTIGVLAALRLCQLVWWLLTPSVLPKKDKK
ncbi:hypothetical protein BCR39DRAFT_549556 [Naematelia encephala]|uniref:Uncharacterized protein n=1 Tax=Naematelia encephala TaxID=71784 RepID=A0A1Y2AL86_9TREE|nr:hypothetical protein BCR39DRAFT_549556 [Naematelia encephala]